MSMVEWKKLGDIAKCYAGATPSTKNSSYWENGIIPWMSSGEVHQGIVTHTATHITQLGYDSSSTKMLPKGSVVIALAGQGKTRGSVAITDIELCTNQSLCGIVLEKTEIINKYVYYFLGTRYNHLRKISSGEGTRGGLNLRMISDYIIPIPAISEQQRIVNILDTFTSSIDNLKQQIAQRRKQYEYYRDQLLDLEGKDGVEMKSCGEVCEVTDYVANGSFATLRENVSYRQEPDYAVLVRTIDLSNNFDGDKVYIDERAYKFLSKSSLFGGEIIINNIGAGVGQTFRCPYLKEKMSLGPNSILVRTPNNDFYYYWFNSIYGQNAMMKVVTPGAMPKFNKTGFKTITVPVPSLSEQQRIVDILDKFEASIQNLEAQLSQREKQYEYYRNKLLTFE